MDAYFIAELCAACDWLLVSWLSVVDRLAATVGRIDWVKASVSQSPQATSNQPPATHTQGARNSRAPFAHLTTEWPFIHTAAASRK